MKVDVFAIQWKDKSLPSRVLLDVKQELLDKSPEEFDEEIAALLHKKYRSNPIGFYLSYKRPAKRKR